MSKDRTRSDALAKRDALAAEWRNEQSRALPSFVDALGVPSGALVSGFLPIRSEIDLQPLLAALNAKDVALCLPVVLNRETIVFRRYNSGFELVDTGFGTRGPGLGAETVDPDVMLMPLAAFDDHGNRLGYGAGHYDRAIARLIAKGKRPRLIGCAFACQRVERISAETHDVPLDAVLTEEGLTHFQREA